MEGGRRERATVSSEWLCKLDILGALTCPGGRGSGKYPVFSCLTEGAYSCPVGRGKLGNDEETARYEVAGGAYDDDDDDDGC